MTKGKSALDSVAAPKVSEDSFVTQWFAERASDADLNQSLLAVLKTAYQQDTSEVVVVALLEGLCQKVEGTDAADKAD